MAVKKILLRRGTKAQLPALAVGEPGFTTDTHELYIGTASGNKKIGDLSDYYKKSETYSQGQIDGAFSLKVDKTQKVNNKALAGDIRLYGEDITFDYAADQRIDSKNVQEVIIGILDDIGVIDNKLIELESLSPTIILGVKGEPSTTNELTRYDGAGSYPIEVTQETSGDYELYKWDDTKWPYNQFREVVDLYMNVFIKVPKMYRKYELDGSGVLNNRYISNQALEGFELPKCFIDPETGEELPYILVGKYNGADDGGSLTSKSGVAPQVSTTLATSRTRAMQNGEGYHLLDFPVKEILETLYLVTFANTNPATMFPQGVEGTRQNNGMLDAMPHHTGYTKGLNNYLMKFMGIENYFSNVYTQVDGIKIVDHEVYLSDDYRNYNSREDIVDYYRVADVPKANRSINQLGVMGIPKATGIARYQNHFYQKAGYATLFFGRAWTVSSYYGLFCWRGNYGLDYAYSSIGVRLVRRALQ